MSSGLQLKKSAKMLEISSFFVFQGNSAFWMKEQAELNQAFLAKYGEPSQAFWKAWRAEPTFFPKSSSQNWANSSLGSDQTLLLIQ